MSTAAASAHAKKRMLCLPGLGGHKSVFDEYRELLSDYDLQVIEIVDHKKALRDARAALAAEPQPVPVFCHCYGAQFGIQLALEMPEKVTELIFLEPFFAQFSWSRRLRPIGVAFAGLSKLKDMLGLRRTHFTYVPDYVALAKYPDWMQPIFDLRWQPSTEYWEKYLDVIDFRLPARVDTPTLMMFSPHGFTRDPQKKAKIAAVFPNSRIVTMEQGTHNVISVSSATVAGVLRQNLAAA